MNKKLIKKIVNYWYIMDFLGQDDHPYPEVKSCGRMLKKLETAVKKGEPINTTRVSIAIELTPLQLSYECIEEQVRTQLDKLKDICGKDYRLCGDITVYLGDVSREQYLGELIRVLSSDFDEKSRPEKMDKRIAAAVLQLNGSFVYKADSLSISPILWALNELRSSGRHSASALTYDGYKDSVDELNKWFSEDVIALRELYGKLTDIYYTGLECSEEKTHPFIMTFEAACNLRDNDETESDIPKLGMSFYANDLGMVLDNIDDLPEHLADYITAESEFEGRPADSVDLVKNTPEKICEEFDRILDPRKAPLGKWCGRFSPALMQQAAINSEIDREGIGRIFSVNGPPGTGKTTMLKEIIVNNIVERARLMYEYTENAANNSPDELFGQYAFSHVPNGRTSYDRYIRGYYALKPEYDRINDYGIVVASCNNAAVENISKELPIDSFANEAASGDEFGEVAALFSPEYTERTLEVCVKHRDEQTGKTGYVTESCPDVYFSHYADALLPEDKKAWGLIAAPMGKRKNLSAFYWKVLFPYLGSVQSNAKTDAYLETFKEERIAFKAQLDKVLTLRKKIEAHADEVRRSRSTGSWKAEERNVINDDFAAVYLDKESVECTKVNVAEFWFDSEYDREREKLFYRALQLNKYFVLSSKRCRNNLITLSQYWGFRKAKVEENAPAQRVSFDSRDAKACVPALFQTLLLLVPVISSTFASIGMMFKDVNKPNVIGNLIIDESGQASPECAVGAIFRSRRVLAVGDPKQVEPVVTDDLKLLRDSFDDPELSRYKNTSLSVQVLADELNRYGTVLTDTDEDTLEVTETWVGCPLVVHRRCVSPMFDISNAVSYNGIMKNETAQPKPKVADGFLFDRSCWIDIPGSENGNKDHYVPEHGKRVAELIVEAFQKSSDTPNIYIISPFTSVVRGVREEIHKYAAEVMGDGAALERLEEWLGSSIGTVHKFQGKEANEVFFMLGCDSTSVPAIKWVNKNIVNVAVSRARYRIYIVGNYSPRVWQQNQKLVLAHDLINNDHIEF